MMPVDAVTTLVFGIERAFAVSVTMMSTASIPEGPVSAFALPLLMTIARMCSFGSIFSAWTTGAAFAKLTVNAPTQTASTSERTRARSLFFGLSPQGTPENL